MTSWISLCFIIAAFYTLNEVNARKAQGKLSYEMNWSGGIGLCNDVEQDLLNLDNLIVEKESATGTLLGGSFDIVNQILNGTSANAYVNKNTDQGVVLMTVVGIENICSHVADEDRPWTMIFNAMNLEEKSCPLPVKTFELDYIKLNLSSMEDFLTRDNVGEYNIRIEMLFDKEGSDDSSDDKGADSTGNPSDDKDVVGCFTIGMSIDEVREKE